MGTDGYILSSRLRPRICRVDGNLVTMVVDIDRAVECVVVGDLFDSQNIQSQIIVKCPNRVSSGSTIHVETITTDCRRHIYSSIAVLPNNPVNSKCPAVIVGETI